MKARTVFLNVWIIGSAIAAAFFLAFFFIELLKHDTKTQCEFKTINPGWEVKQECPNDRSR